MEHAKICIRGQGSVQNVGTMDAPHDEASVSRAEDFEGRPPVDVQRVFVATRRTPSLEIPAFRTRRVAG